VFTAVVRGVFIAKLPYNNVSRKRLPAAPHR
jgi:hypothetical protein